MILVNLILFEINLFKWILICVFKGTKITKCMDSSRKLLITGSNFDILYTNSLSLVPCLPFSDTSSGWIILLLSKMESTLRQLKVELKQLATSQDGCNWFLHLLMGWPQWLQSKSLSLWERLGEGLPMMNGMSRCSVSCD